MTGTKDTLGVGRNDNGDVWVFSETEEQQISRTTEQIKFSIIEEDGFKSYSVIVFAKSVNLLPVHQTCKGKPYSKFATLRDLIGPREPHLVFDVSRGQQACNSNTHFACVLTPLSCVLTRIQR